MTSEGLAFRAFMAVVILGLAAVPASSDIPPAGSLIISQSVAEYFDGSSLQTVQSNVVQIRVLPIYDIRLTPVGTVAAPAYSLRGAGSDTLYCSFELTNLGNAHDSVTVGYRLVPPSNTTITGVVFFDDANGNGVFDTGEDDPAFLATDPGEAEPLNAAVILPAGGFGGNAYVEVAAVSVIDTLPVPQRSVFLVTNTDAPELSLYLGPHGNPKALPGGEGSDDDRSEGFLDYSCSSYEFENDIFNEGDFAEQIVLSLADSVTLPPGISVFFADSVGQVMPRSPTRPSTFLVGPLGPGETRPIRVRVTSASGPLCRSLEEPLALTIRARSAIDTLQQNFTVDRLLPPRRLNLSAALSLKQTFREPTASVGDVVTFVVTAQNITDSVRVDSATVVEFVQPQLDFLGSPDFVWSNGRLIWRAGTLLGGESKTGIIKFAVNGRVSTGKAKVVGNVNGTAETGDRVSAGPVISSIAIDNDVFASEGIVFGEVYVDFNGNGARETNEAGVGGVAIFLDSGEYAVTDSLGRYSIPRAFAGYRTVRLDETSLPDDVVVAGSTGVPNEERRRSECLVHLLPAGHARVTFPLQKRATPPPRSTEITQTVTCQEIVGVNKQRRLYRAFSLPSSYFALGKAELMKGAAEKLRPTVDFLLAHPDWGVLLEGHTDSIPIHTERFPSNVELSIARTEAVKAYLVWRDINGERVVNRGYGEKRPLASNATVEGRRMNRRVEVSFIPPGLVIGGGGDVRTVDATIKDLGALPDTFKVSVLWQLATTSTDARDASLRVHVPDRFLDTKVSVLMDGRQVVIRDGRFDLSGFARFKDVRCEIRFVCGAQDTAHIGDIEATLELHRSSRLASTGVEAEAGALESPSVFVVKPRRGDRGTNKTRFVELASWRELVPDEPSGGEPVGSADPPLGRAGEDRKAPAEPKYQNTDAACALLEPGDGDVFSRTDRVRVRARLPLGGKTTVAVNKEAVSDRHVGRKVVDVNAGVEEITWYDVGIRSGWNTITLSTTLLDGTRLADSVRVALASRPASVEAKKNRVLLPADGRTTETIRFAVTDCLGLPVVDGTVANVVDGVHILANDDARPGNAGLQVASEGGHIALEIRPQDAPGRVPLVVECDGLRASCEVVFVTAARSTFATGLVDLKLGVFDAKGDGSPLGLEDFYDGVALKSTSRLFVRSAMRHGVNLTARLDTKKRYDDPLLKDVNTDRQYPIYGDASQLYFAAPSRGGNYVSLDKGESYLRFGDFRTPLAAGEFLTYNRAANGVTSSFVRGNSSFSSFATKTDFSTFKDEIRADGTSGFYYLTRTPVVENSERILLETRDRYQLENVVEVKPLVRNRDYTINPFDGSILFKEPVSVTDRDFNPVFIVVIYEVDTEEDAQYLYGVRGDLRESARYRVGTAAVARSGDGERYALYGLDGEVNVAGVTMNGEFARSEDGLSGDGNAFKVEAAYQGASTQHSAYLRRVDGGFSNPSFRGSSHELSSIKSGFKSRLRISNAISVDADGFLHRLDRTEEEKSNVRAQVSFQDRAFNFFCGVRGAQHEKLQENHSGVLSILGLGIGSQQSAEFSSRWEKNLGSESVEDYPDRLKSTAAVPFKDKYKLVVSHEYLSARGRGGSNQAAAGLESQLTRSTTAYTKYTMNRTAGDDRMGALAGLRRSLRLREGLSGLLGFENFHSMSNRDDEEYVSVKAGLTGRKSRSHLVEGQYEYRWQKRRTKHLVRVNASRQLSNGFAVLLRDVLSYSPDKDAENALSYQGRVGVAFRPLAWPVKSLASMKNSYERYTPANPDAITWKLVVATDVNVTPAPDHEVRMKYAFKRVEDYSYGISFVTNTDLVLSQYVRRFGPCWDVDVWGRMVRRRAGGTTELGAGVEIGRMFLKWIRVGGGYSVGGFEDPDISGTDAWSKGFGLRVQLILSDWVLREFGGM